VRNDLRMIAPNSHLSMAPSNVSSGPTFTYQYTL
jgi:hypothetical protein